MKILVTGATGYVGGRLVPWLLERDHTVRTTTSDPSREQPWWGDRVETVTMDALDPDQVRAACEGVDVVYYLIHGMGGDDFAETDRAAATNFADGVRDHGVDKVVYLSGLIPDAPEDELSEHITSRRDVEQILTGAPATVITLRAAVLVGSGSTSFEIIRQVSERMPVHTVPTWMNSMVQPIAIVDVLEALIGALGYDGPSRHFDLGGPDTLRYGALLDAYAAHAGLVRPQVEVPLVPTALVGTLVGSLTDVPRPTVEALVESLHHDMVVAETDFRELLLPRDHQLVGLDEAFRRALAPRDTTPDAADPMGPLPQDPAWASGGDERPAVAKAIDAVKDLLGELMTSPALVVVTGANGLVGARVCHALVERGATVQAVVRRAGAAPELAGVEEQVGDFTDADFAAAVVAGADAVVSTVHPMQSDRETQHRIGAEATPALARVSADAGVEHFIHLSTTAVYDRTPGVGDVDESSRLVDDDAGDYAVTKRDTDLALAEVAGITRVLVRPPAILGSGASSVWNTLRPRALHHDEDARHAVPDQTFAWVHVDDLADLVADLAVGRLTGPARGGCTAVNAAAGSATMRDYYATVARALGVDPVWDDAPAWTGRILTRRALGWGWAPTVDLDSALAELAAGLPTA